VDGIEKLNTTLTALLDGSQSSDAVQAAALVGKGVMVEGKALTLSGGKAYGGIELASAADKVTVTIKDANGLEVRKLELGDAEPAFPTSPGTASPPAVPRPSRQIHDERQRHPRRHRSQADGAAALHGQ
jgi:flagellar hook assembly protein FlgD